MRYRDLAGKLTQLGCHEVQRRGDGSHRKWLNPATGRSTVIPDWAERDLKLGTVRAIIRQLGLTWEEFDRS